jgi:DNA adenine methylase
MNIQATQRLSPWSRPLFRWAGSKRRLLPELQRSIPRDFSRYVEPFAGSACLFFALNPSRALLADFNAELMHAYEVVAKHPLLVHRTSDTLPIQDNCDYYDIRHIDPNSLTDVERAARFMYLNRYCFNGVYRTDRNQRFNVPRGSRPGRPLTQTEVLRCAHALSRCELRTADFEEILNDVDSADFVYIDPPYTHNDRPTLGEYGYGAFGPADLDRLIAALRRLTAIGAKVLLSYAQNERIVAQLDGWNIRTVAVRRQVGGGAKPRECREILASNY